MRAVVHDTYGPPEVLRIDDVRRPVPNEGEVLGEVHATSVTRSDCGFRQAHPFFVLHTAVTCAPKWCFASCTAAVPQDPEAP